jgi:dTDP-4-amino-4,6-dideoxygalactose transaminase
VIEFNDLHAQRARLGDRIDKAIEGVLQRGAFISGPEVSELEARLAGHCGVDHAIACASGTDAIVLALMALGIGPGDAVVVPTFTFAATAEAVALVGATPVFADVLAETYNLDPVSALAALDVARHQGLRPRAVIAVDLFGQPADYDALGQLCANAGIELIADAAQSFGAKWREQTVGSLARLTTTSFFPAKPLGCYGDGGAVFTTDAELAARLRSLRVHGQGTDKYDNARIGLNSRLDTIQAAILLAKLEIFEDELEARGRVAARYDALLGGAVTVPRVDDRATSVWAQYTIESPDRDAIAGHLREGGIPTAVYYRVSLHEQTAYRHFPRAATELLVARLASERVLSLPMHPYLDDDTQEVVAKSVRSSLEC